MTQPTTLKPFSTFIDIIRRLAAEQPDRRSECRYFGLDVEGKQVAAADRQPDCIAGHAFAELGAVSEGTCVVVGDDVVIRDGQEIRLANWSVLSLHDPDETQESWIADVQAWQDGRFGDSGDDGDHEGRYRWAQAVEAADWLPSPSPW